MRAVIANLPVHWEKERFNSEIAQWDEMWSGVLHMPPIPNRVHQDFEMDLGNYLKWNWAIPNGNRIHHQVNLTTPEDEERWTKNYRIPDLVLLTPDRFAIDKCDNMAGAPLVCVEIFSPGDESYEKLPFYAELGVPEVWIVHRDTKEPTVFVLDSGSYVVRVVDSDGWSVSPATGIGFKRTIENKLRVRIPGREPAELPVSMR